MNLSELLPKPSPYRAIFKKEKFPVKAVARFLGYSYGYTSNLLCGTCAMTPEVDDKLAELVKKIREAKKNDRKS